MLSQKTYGRKSPLPDIGATSPEGAGLELPGVGGDLALQARVVQALANAADPSASPTERTASDAVIFARESVVLAQRALLAARAKSIESTHVMMDSEERRRHAVALMDRVDERRRRAARLAALGAARLRARPQVRATRGPSGSRTGRPRPR